MQAAPSGTVTFLFTDIEGSTRLWDIAPDAMKVALARHDEILLTTFTEHDGRVFSTGGDGFGVAFPRAADALAASIALQDALNNEAWPAKAPIRVRVGVHTGEAIERDDNFFGTSVNTAARVMALAHGGQTLCTSAVLGVIDDPPSTIDLGEHRLRDLMAPTALHQVGQAEFPPLRSAVAVPTNLPSQVTTLIGRADLVGELTDDLHDHRLVTVTGAGGIGKTRVALEVATLAAPRFPDGAWFVDLAPVIDAADIVRTIAATMGATAAAGSAEALYRHLEGRHALLILDNCEHLIEGVAEVASTVLAGSPQLVLLTTSREPLDVAGELIRHVRPLDLPDPRDPAGDIGHSPAVALFVERARSARSSFELDDQNVDSVTEICRRLDGVPLAIELAAARVGAMSPHDICDRLDERFRLLAGGRRGQERHRTLLAAVSWSYDLLTDDERRAFRSLAELTGSFDLADAAAIVGGDAADEFETLDLVTRLVERSLLNHQDDGRYRLLETLRQFGADRLAEADEASEVRARFVEHFLSLGLSDGARLNGPEYPTAKAHLAASLDNLSATVDLLIGDERVDDVAALISATWQFLSQEAPAAGIAWFRALDGDLPIDPQRLYDALWAIGIFSMNLASVEDALGLDTRAQELVEKHPDIIESAWTQDVAVTMALFMGDEALMRDATKQMIAVGERTGEDAAVLYARCTRLLFDAAHVDTATLRSQIDDQLAEAARLGSPIWTGVAVSMSVAALIADAHAVEAWPQMLEILETHKQWRLSGSIIESSILVSEALARTFADPVGALDVAVDAIALGDRLGTHHQISNALTVAALVACNAGWTDAAVMLVRHRLAIVVFDNPWDRIPRSRILESLEAADVDLGSLTPHLLARRELFGCLAQLQADVAAAN